MSRAIKTSHLVWSTMGWSLNEPTQLGSFISEPKKF